MLKHLKQNKIFCNVSYPFPIHLMKGYKNLNYKKGDLPITEKISKEIISIPMYPYLNSQKLKKIVKTLNEFN